MKKLLLLLLLLSLPAVGQTISPLSGCTGTNSCTVTGLQAGDLLIAIAGRDGSSSVTGIPAGWTSVTSSSINGTGSADSSILVACSVSIGSSVTATFSALPAANKLAVQAYRNTVAGTTATCASVNVGTPQKFTSTVDTTTTTLTYPGVTTGNSKSFVVELVYAPAATAGLDTGLAGLTQRQLNGSVMSIEDTNAGVSSYSQCNGTTCPTFTTASRLMVVAVEIMGHTDTSWSGGSLNPTLTASGSSTAVAGRFFSPSPSVTASSSTLFRTGLASGPGAGAVADVVTMTPSIHGNRFFSPTLAGTATLSSTMKAGRFFSPTPSATATAIATMKAGRFFHPTDTTTFSSSVTVFSTGLHFDLRPNIFLGSNADLLAQFDLAGPTSHPTIGLTATAVQNSGSHTFSLDPRVNTDTAVRFTSVLHKAQTVTVVDLPNLFALLHKSQTVTATEIAKLSTKEIKNFTIATNSSVKFQPTLKRSMTDTVTMATKFGPKRVTVFSITTQFLATIAKNSSSSHTFHPVFNDIVNADLRAQFNLAGPTLSSIIAMSTDFDSIGKHGPEQDTVTAAVTKFAKGRLSTLAPTLASIARSLPKFSVTEHKTIADTVAAVAKLQPTLKKSMSDTVAMTTDFKAVSLHPSAPIGVVAQISNFSTTGQHTFQPVVAWSVVARENQKTSNRASAADSIVAQGHLGLGKRSPASDAVQMKAGMKTTKVALCNDSVGMVVTFTVHTGGQRRGMVVTS